MFAIIHYQLTSDKSSFSFVTNFLLLPIFFIITLLSCNGIHAHSTIHTLCRTYWQIHYYVYERPSLIFDSFTVLFLSLFLFLYSQLAHLWRILDTSTDFSYYDMGRTLVHSGSLLITNLMFTMLPTTWIFTL